ncbi:MFS transporter [Comamonadaceae bacterium OH2545_COT-014]|nr:MFS transporter [Comamonadaceae bacterium OH2545_COT-014]
MPAAAAPLPRRAAVAVFLAFAFAYFLSTLLRAVTATLSPALTAEFGVSARDLGLLAGGYFLGFAAMQLPLGAWLDRYGPRRVILRFLGVAALGCAAFALAGSFAALLAARVLIGVGVAACLMAPLAGYRRWFDAGAQLRANAWMLMTGSLGMLCSTLPVQWLLPHTGWRALFWALAALLLLAMVWIARIVPGPPGAIKKEASQAAITAQTAQTAENTQNIAARPPAAGHGGADADTDAGGYGAVWRSPVFRRAAPLAFVCHAGMVAIQTLWAGPWLTRVAGATPLQAAQGLFAINLAMLAAFWLWGLALPHLTRRGVAVPALVAWLLPLSLLPLAALALGGPALGAWSAPLLVLYCTLSTATAQLQPAVAMTFAPQLAGRALSAYNLLIFSGVFVMQWGIGLAVDGLQHLGWPAATALQGAFGLFTLVAAALWLRFAWGAAGRAPSAMRQG